MDHAFPLLFGPRDDAAEPQRSGFIEARMADEMFNWTEAMRAGRFEEAFALSASVLRARDPATRDASDRPYHERWVWDGRALDGRHVLVRCYHGLGDTLQFARYLAPLARRAASVTLEVQAHLVPLLRQLPDIARLVPFDPAAPAPPSECDIEIGELPFALRLTPGGAPAHYLHAAPAPLPPGTIGLCHQAGEWDPSRCVPAALLAPLCRGRTSVTLAAAPSALPVRNPEGAPLDIVATAALVAGCALVITVDTMIAHLAGALGRPTWLLLKAEPDWRWTPGAPASPWYPAMRLFHQPHPGAWQPVLRAVQRALDSAFPRAGAHADVSSDQPARPDLVG